MAVLVSPKQPSSDRRFSSPNPSPVADKDLEARVKNFLIGYRMPTLSQVRVEADHGAVRLRGKVNSFFQKQLCLSCCRRVAGVLRVVDELDVSASQ